MHDTDGTTTEPGACREAGAATRRAAAPAPARTSDQLHGQARTAAFLLPFALIVYLGMERGGYATVVYSQVGQLAWWTVLLGVLAGALPVARVGRPAWLAFGLLVAFALWSAAALSWTTSSERTLIEVARVACYLGVFAIALMTASADRLRPVLAGVGAGCAAIAVVAVLSRLQPSWFPAYELPDVLPATESRLAYPVNYWNGLAGLVAVGLPLIVWIALEARSLAARCAAVAVAPVMVLCLYYTLSRGGALAATLGVAVLIALGARRLAMAPTLAVAGVASAALLWAAERRPSLQSGVIDPTALAQGDAMTYIAIAVAFAAGLSLAALRLLRRHGHLPPIPTVPRHRARAAGLALAVAAIAAFVAIGGPAKVSDGWEQFKSPANPGAQAGRLASASGNGRWQYWSSAVRAFDSEPLHGIGPGTFVFWWSQDRDIPGFIRDAHSLFVEVLGELGIVGLLLIAALIALVLGTGVLRSARSRRPPERLALAAATGSCFAFALVAGIDWMWELTVVPVAFLFVAAAILQADSQGRSRFRITGEGRFRGVAVAAATLLVAAAAYVMIEIPKRGVIDVSQSQALARAGDLEGALAAAQDAHELQPYAASPLVQEALVLERLGKLSKAATAARSATAAESTNWETWYVLSQIQSLRGDKQGAALVALRRAQSLDPLSPLLNPQANAPQAPGA